MESGNTDKNRRKSLLLWMRQYQFNWIGRTKDGVNRWVGAPKGPSERACRNSLRYGIAMAVVGTIAALAALTYSGANSPLAFLALIGGIHGVVFTVLGIWLRKMQGNLAKLKSVEEIAKEFGSTPETVQRLADARNIRARININDNNLYDPEEFVASRSLLRGASSPLMPETLLRAAQPTAFKAASKALLRPVEPEQQGNRVALTPVQRLFFETNETDETDETDETVSTTQTLRH